MIKVFFYFSITCLYGTAKRINFTVNLLFPTNTCLGACIQRSFSNLMKDVMLRQFILTGASFSVNIYKFCCISLYKNDNKLLLHPRENNITPSTYWSCTNKRPDYKQTGFLTGFWQFTKHRTC